MAGNSNTESEILRLTRENNEMLKKVCAFIDRVESNDYQNQEEMRNLFTNLLANLMFNIRRRF